MVRMQRLTALVTTGLLMGALLACKKKPEAAPEASATAPVAPAPTPSAVATPTPAETAATAPTTPPSEAKLGDVKRYGVEKESKLDEAGVRVAADELKVFNEADTTTPEVATLPKGLLVFRLVKMDDFQLVEFPSGIGQFSKGWVETKGLTDKPEKVTRDAALSEKKTATVKPVDGGVAPSPSGSAAPKPSASVAPKPSASVAPKPSAEKPPAPPKPDPKKKDKKKEEEKK